MPSEHAPNLSHFFSVLQTLEAVGAPYMIIGAFAAAMYGNTRTTYDIDIVVDLSEENIAALVAAYPPPRYYADSYQMHDAIRHGIMFNIIDAGQGEKADLIPLSMASPYRHAFERRVRQPIDLPSGSTLEVWCARPEDVIVGKLRAWAEGRSRKHETDIYGMLLFHYLGVDPTLSAGFDEAYIDDQAAALGVDVARLWLAIKDAAHREASQS